MTLYRKAEIKDIPLLVQLRISQLDDEEEHPDIEIRDTLTRWFEQVLKDGSLYQILAEEDGQVIACGALLQLDMPPSFFKPTGKIGYITDMYTLPEYRRKGYASKILELLREEAVRRDIDRMILEASQWGEHVYSEFGFKKLEWWMQYILKGGEY